MSGRVLLVQVTEGGPLFTPEALSLLTGVPADEIRAEIRNFGLTSLEGLPADWLRAGRRRASEARAVTGTADALTGLRYLAAREHNVELVMEADGLYMPVCPRRSSNFER